MNFPRLDLRNNPNEGQHQADLSAVFALDWASAGTVGTLNIGDRALIFSRVREPVSPKGDIGTGGVTINPGAPGIRSQIEPVIPITGSTTYDPNAPDAQLARDFFNRIVGPIVNPNPPQTPPQNPPQP